MAVHHSVDRAVGQKSERAMPSQDEDVVTEVGHALLMWCRTHAPGTYATVRAPADLTTLTSGQRGAVDDLTTWIEVSAGTRAPSEPARAERAPAGTFSDLFLGSWIPIASDGGGGVLFVDRRRGGYRNCVSTYDAETGSSEGPLWPSLAAMLVDVVEALRTQRAVMGWRPFVEGGRLEWDVV